MRSLAVLGSPVVCLAALAGQPGHAADTQKSGQATFDAYVTARQIGKLDIALGSASVEEDTGFDRLVSGNAPFDLLTFRCVGYDQKVGGKSSSWGGCVKTDKDGDHILYTWNPDGWIFTDGTGKFRGITGKGTFKPIYFHDSGERGYEAIVRHDGEWEIK